MKLNCGAEVERPVEVETKVKPGLIKLNCGPIMIRDYKGAISLIRN